MSRLAWEVTFGGLCWLAAGVVAVACWAAFTREDRLRADALAKAREAVDELIATLQADPGHHIALWEEELAPQRPIYDVEEDGL